MKRLFSCLVLLLLITFGTTSCKKCTTCTAKDNAGRMLSDQDYCSTVCTNVTTFENSFKSTYGHNAICTRH